jgi:hypothetical protein
MTMGVDRLVFRGFYRPRASSPRYEMVGSFRINFYSPRGGSGTVSCDLYTSKDPCCSILHLSGGGGGSRLTGGRPRSLRDRWSS